MEFQVEDDPDPLDIEFLDTQIRREASAAMGLGDEVELAIFVRDAGAVVAGISGWTWGDCCELQSLWVQPSLRGRGLATRLIAAAEAEAAARGCSQTVHFTYAFQARGVYDRNGYESRELPIRNRRTLVPQAPETIRVAAEPVALAGLKVSARVGAREPLPTASGFSRRRPSSTPLARLAASKLRVR